MTQMVEVKIDSVRVSLTNQQRIVLLKELGTECYLPIWIGPYEAEAITISLQEIEVARPQTHDLLVHVIEKLNARLIRVEVIALRGDVFYGILIVDQAGTILSIDARPSDSIALAVRSHVPILVAREVLETAGITPEEDLQLEAEEPTEDLSPKSAEAPAAESEERLSVFEQFLKNVDLDSKKDEDQTNSGEPAKPKE